MGRDALLGSLRDAVAAVDDGAAPIGVCFPGMLADDGRAAFCANLPGLDGVLLAEALAPGRRVVALPDLQAAVIGEARLGAGRGVARFLCVALGTGANAAMTVDGVPLETAYACLGDAGQICVEPDGPPC